MEYAPSLSDYIQNNTLSLEQKLKLGIDILEALSLCNDFGIIHRDIKEENIFISDKGVFKLGDFGVSKSLENTMNAATKVGTYLYMAPEVISGSQYTLSADIYSIGIVLYKLFNHGRVPFLPPYPAKFNVQDVETAQMQRLAHAVIPYPNDCDQELAKIIIKALSLNPQNRYGNPRLFKKTLEKYIQNKNLTFKGYNNNLNQTIKIPVDNNFIYPGTNNTIGIFESENSINKNKTAAKTVKNPSTKNIRNKYKIFVPLSILLCISIGTLYLLFSKNTSITKEPSGHLSQKSTTADNLTTTIPDTNQIVVITPSTSTIIPSPEISLTTVKNSPTMTTPSTTKSVAPDTTKSKDTSSSPSNIKAIEVAGNNIFIGWDAPASGNAVEYKVYVNGKYIADEYPYDTTFRNTKLSAGTTYKYYITSIDDNGVESAPSSTVAIKTLSDGSTPAAALIKAYEVTQTSITIQWEAPASEKTITHYLITINGNYYGSLKSTTMCTIGDLSPGTKYDIEIESVNSVGNFSPKSNILSVTTKE